MKRTLLTLLLALTFSAFAGLEEGKAALEVGNYPLAEKEFATLSGPKKLYFQAQIRLKRRSSLQDLESARNLLEGAAQAGYAPAMTALGESYNRVESFGSGEAAGYLEPEGDKVFAWLSKAAGAGDPQGMFRLAEWYDGIDDAANAARNKAQALEWYQKAAAAGNGAALYQMGQFYLEGVQVPKDPAQTGTLWNQAVKVGNPDAMVALAAQLEAGKSDAALEGALTLYLKAAEAGDVRGMVKLGRAYLNGVFGGETLPKDLTKALRWLEAAAATGDADAGYEAGVVYARGVGVKKDLEKAEKLLGNQTDSGLGFTVYARSLEGDFQDFAGALYWYGKGAGAQDPDALDPDALDPDALDPDSEEPGDPEAQSALARLYLSRKPGVPYDPALAFHWADWAARTGRSAEAKAFLASLYEGGLGTEKNLDRALELYQDAVRAGEQKDYAGSIARVRYALGVAFENDQGRGQDYAQAASLYRQAAEGGQMDAAAQLGFLYFVGRGVPQDDPQAVLWSRRAADAGNPKGLYNLGLALELGRGVKKDPNQALELYQKAAALDHVPAKGSIGSFYFNGTVVPQDLQRAAYWFSQGAEGGDRDAQYNLGVCYENGYGLTKDLERARLWYDKAAAQGLTRARDALARLDMAKP